MPPISIVFIGMLAIIVVGSSGARSGGRSASGTEGIGSIGEVSRRSLLVSRPEVPADSGLRRGADTSP
jgi:hypothetical protein